MILRKLSTTAPQQPKKDIYNETNPIDINMKQKSTAKNKDTKIIQ